MLKQKPSATPVYQNLPKSKIIQRSPQRRINNSTNNLSLLSYSQGKALKFCIKISVDLWLTNKIFVISLVTSKESIFSRSVKHTWPLTGKLSSNFQLRFPGKTKDFWPMRSCRNVYFTINTFSKTFRS